MLSLRQNVMVAVINAGQKEKKWYSATVLDLYDNEALISLPKLRGQALETGEDDLLEISFLDGEARYSYQSSVREKFDQEALVIDQPRDLERIDLRQFPRVSAEIEVFYAEQGLVDAGPEYKKGCLLDISGNGMRLMTDQIYNPGTMLLLSFDLPVGDSSVRIYIEGKVVRVIVSDQKDPVEYQLGVKYQKLDKGQQEMIIGYINNLLNKKAD